MRRSAAMSLVVLMSVLCRPAPVDAQGSGQVPQASITADTPLTEVRTDAAQGDATAQNSLGYRYVTGQGVPQDLTEAVRWYRLAAEQGYAAGQYNLGAMYGTGRGVPRDYVEAHTWRTLAAARATGDTQKHYAETRDAVAKAMKEAQLAEAQKRAEDWEAAFALRRRQ